METAATGCFYPSVVDSSRRHPIQVQVAANVEMTEEVPLYELAVSDPFASSGNATPSRDESAGKISQIEAASVESELNDFPSTGQPCSHSPEVTSQDLIPEPHATMDTSHISQDT